MPAAAPDHVPCHPLPTCLQVVGVGGTTAWKLCTLSTNTTLAVVYDIVAQHGGEPGGQGGEHGGGSNSLEKMCVVVPSHCSSVAGGSWPGGAAARPAIPLL